jgi:hypothetical protein
MVFQCDNCIKVLQNLLQSLDRELKNEGHFGFFNGNVTFKVGVEVYAHVLTIIPAAILGLVCGAFAVAFTKLNLAIAAWRARIVKPKDINRLLEVLVMTLVYIGVCMTLPHFFPCRQTECTVPRVDPTASPTCPASLVHSNGTFATTNEDLALVHPCLPVPLLLHAAQVKLDLAEVPDKLFGPHGNPSFTLMSS